LLTAGRDFADRRRRIAERKNDNELGALAGTALGRQLAAVALDNLAADGQTDSGPLVLGVPM
jgi:hypothetical protein